MTWYTVKLTGPAAGLHHTRRDCPTLAGTVDETYGANVPSRDARFCTVCVNRDARETTRA